MMSNKTPPVDTFGTSSDRLIERYITEYIKLGWHILPLHTVINGKCTCGDLSCKSIGKHPIREITPHGLKQATNDLSTARAMFLKQPCNIGVVTGHRSGFFVLDIDINHSKGKFGDEALAELEEKHEKLPDTVEAMTGSGRHILFKTYGSEPINNAPLIKGAIDIRADNGYIVIEPSIHANGHNYTWEASSDPIEGVAIAPAPSWLVNLMELRGSGKTEQDGSDGILGGGKELPLTESEVVRLRSALRFIPSSDYFTWIEVGMALHSVGGQQAFALFDEWSERSKDKYDYEACIAKWSSFDEERIAGWNGVGLSTLFFRAKEYGWSNPDSEYATRYEERVKAAIDNVNGSSRLTIQKIVSDPYQPFPVPELEMLSRWIGAHSQWSHIGANQQAALALASTLAARRYYSRFNDPCHLYLSIIAPSVGDIRYTQRALFSVFNKIKATNLVRQSRLSTPSQIFRFLSKAPNGLYLSDEHGVAVSFSKRQPSGAQEHAMSILARIYDLEYLQIDPEELSQRARQEIGESLLVELPSLSMLSLISDAQLNSAMKNSEIARGAIEQFVFLDIGALPPAYNIEGEQSSIAWPKQLTEIIRKIRVGLGKERDTVQHQANDNMLLKPHVMVVDGDSFESMMSNIKAIGDMHGAPLSIIRGAQVSARRIATTLGAWNNPEKPLITENIQDWATSYIARHLTSFAYRRLTHGVDDSDRSPYQVTLEAILKSADKGVTTRELIHSCWKFRNLSNEKRKLLLESLIDDGLVLSFQEGRKTVFVDARLATKEEAKRTDLN